MMVMYGAPPPRNANLLDDEEVKKRLEVAETLLRRPGTHTKMVDTRHEFVLTADELRTLAGAPSDSSVRYDNGILSVCWTSEKK